MNPKYTSPVAYVTDDGGNRVPVYQEGRAVPILTRDTCGCLQTIHVGPHWLYMDWLDKTINGRMLEQSNPWGFVTEDMARLNRKLAEMKRLGMDKDPHMTVWEALLIEGWDPAVLAVAHHHYNPGKPLPGVIKEAEIDFYCGK